jgi:hypothetical protein
MPNPKQRGWQYTGCFQSVYLETDTDARPKVSSTAAAPEYWYAGVESYSYATHAPKEGATGYVEEGIPCAQSVALAYRYDTKAEAFSKVQAKAPSPAAKLNALDCQKACVVKINCVAYETGPEEHCMLMEWETLGAAATSTRTPQKLEVKKDVKCFIKAQDMQKRRANDFENMVWKSAETAAFGVRSPWVVAWYCSNTFPSKLKDRNVSDRKANVPATQIVDG